MSLSVSEANI